MDAKEIPLGFAECRLYKHGNELHFDMWPAFGTVMTMPLRGPVSKKRVIRNTGAELILARGLFRYRFDFSTREHGPDALKYSVSLLGVLPLGSNWGDVSADGKHALLRAFGG